MNRSMAPGASYLGDGRCRFEVWAPQARSVGVELLSGAPRGVILQREQSGLHVGVFENCPPGTRYFLRLDEGKQLPDPASRFQPEGVHGPSEIVDPSFEWSDSAWRGVEMADAVFYELHVGTYTRAGTFDAIHEHLPRLRDLGITVIELMPVAQFPGERNWGYDGVGLYAVQNSYGGPLGLKRLVDACHRHGIGVMLDVVYNHLGPEGNYLGEFGPYLTEAVRTPWGAALNFAGRESDQVRRFFIENALRWIDEFHFDGLRLDAVHAIHDPTARPLLAELTESTQRRAEQLGRRVLMVAESSANDPRTVRPRAEHGLGCDAQWLDDFHHALHVALSDERQGYYADFDGLAALERAYREAFVFQGQFSQYRGRRHGARPVDIPFERFVVCAQNHDQVGNRMLGDRLSGMIDFESQKLSAAAVLLAPFAPMLFMGEEYGEVAPFQYFVSHSDPALIEAVRAGRRREFAKFEWQGEPPDPQAVETFARCKLDHALREQEPHRTLWQFSRELLALRRDRPALRVVERPALDVKLFRDERVLAIRRGRSDQQSLVLLNFNEQAVQIDVAEFDGDWIRLLDSAEARWRGAGSSTPQPLRPAREPSVNISRRSVVVYARLRETE